MPGRPWEDLELSSLNAEAVATTGQTAVMTSPFRMRSSKTLVRAHTELRFRPNLSEAEVEMLLVIQSLLTFSAEKLQQIVKNLNSIV